MSSNHLPHAAGNHSIPSSTSRPSPAHVTSSSISVGPSDWNGNGPPTAAPSSHTAPTPSTSNGDQVAAGTSAISSSSSSSGGRAPIRRGSNYPVTGNMEEPTQAQPNSQSQAVAGPSSSSSPRMSEEPAVRPSYTNGMEAGATSRTYGQAFDALGAVAESSAVGVQPATAGSKQSQSTHANGAVPTSGTATRRRDQACAACGKPMSGQFVRALGTVYHLDCFKCRVSRCCHAF